MLKLAYQYRDKLNEAWQSVVFDDKYKFYNNGLYWEYELRVHDNSWDKIQMVSVDSKDNVLGYISASCERTSNKVAGLGLINFGEPNIIFAKDAYNFFISLFEKFKFRKIEWNVVIGNPAEKIYDKIIKKLGGNIVGIQHESTITEYGIVRDVKEYELLQTNYNLHNNLKN